MPNIQLVQIQPEERLAAPSELNPASSLVTGCGEARRMGYWAATQVKGFSQCSEAICWSCGCKTHHCNSQFGNVVISGCRWGDSTAESSEGLRTSQDDLGMTKTVPITEEARSYPDNEKEFVDRYNAVLEKAVASYCLPPTVKAPLVDLLKPEIIKKGVEVKAPLQLSYSCSLGEKKHCGICDSCQHRRRGFKDAGVDDPTEYISED